MKRTPIIPIRWVNEQHDTDRDSVPNYRDCNPWNPNQHGIFRKKKEKPKCKKCGTTEGTLLPFKKGESEEFQICMECYDALSKSDKKKLTYTGKWLQMNKKQGYALGFVVGGVFGASTFNSGYESGARSAVKRSLTKHNMTQKQLDSSSIDEYNKHYWLCSEKEHTDIGYKLGLHKKIKIFGREI